MHKFKSGLLSLVILCVCIAPLGFAATKKVTKAPKKTTAAKVAPAKKKGKTTRSCGETEKQPESALKTEG